MRRILSILLCLWASCVVVGAVTTTVIVSNATGIRISFSLNGAPGVTSGSFTGDNGNVPAGYQQADLFDSASHGGGLITGSAYYCVAQDGYGVFYNCNPPIIDIAGGTVYVVVSGGYTPPQTNASFCVPVVNTSGQSELWGLENVDTGSVLNLDACENNVVSVPPGGNANLCVQAASTSHIQAIQITSFGIAQMSGSYATGSSGQKLPCLANGFGLGGPLGGNLTGTNAAPGYISTNADSGVIAAIGGTNAISFPSGSTNLALDTSVQVGDSAIVTTLQSGNGSIISGLSALQLSGVQNALGIDSQLASNAVGASNGVGRVVSAISGLSNAIAGSGGSGGSGSNGIAVDPYLAT